MSQKSANIKVCFLWWFQNKLLHSHQFSYLQGHNKCSRKTIYFELNRPITLFLTHWFLNFRTVLYISLFHSFLTNSQPPVLFCDIFSSSWILKPGVPQGYNIEHLIFIYVLTITLVLFMISNVSFLVMTWT